MRVEDIPIVVGVLVALLGAALIRDAVIPSSAGPLRDRRRRTRAAVSERGEAFAGAGILALGAALIGRDWRYETLTVLGGVLLLAVGAVLSRAYIKEMLFYRGAARRGLPHDDDKSKSLRIR